VGVDHVLALGQRLQRHQAGVQPVGVRVLGGQFRLDLVVGDDPAGRRVDQEHPARLEPPLGHHAVRVDVEHAGLAAEHDQPVAGLPPAARPQPVAVEHRADHRAVGERDAGRAVPRLHQARVELVERAPARLHVRVVLPRLGNHHEHGVRERPAGQVQQLQHLVEVGRVGRVRRAHGEQPADVAGNVHRGQQRLAGVHPVLVAADGVDLAVVGDEAVRVRQRPRRERVRGEAGVHQRDRAGDPLVDQVGEERRKLVGGQHALVDERAGGQRREVRGDAALAGLPFGLLAHAVRDPVQVDAGQTPAGAGGAVARRRAGEPAAGEEDLADPGHGLHGSAAQAVGVDRNVAPAEDLGALDHGVLLQHPHGPVGAVAVGQEHQPGRVLAGRRQREVDHGPEELVWDLEHDPGAVTGVGLGAARAPVVQPHERRQALGHHTMAAAAVQVRHERHAARVMLVRRVVEGTGAGLRCLRMRMNHRASRRHSSFIKGGTTSALQSS
jgi:hypothetical protein